MDGLAEHVSQNYVEILSEKTYWHARNVRYLRGTWDQLQVYIPTFKISPFESKSGTVDNPYLRQVVRLPTDRAKSEIPVGVVSPKYSLAQHLDVAWGCVNALRNSDLDVDELVCELGLTELGEWMNFRIVFPADYEIDPGDGHKVKLRLECFNSVDGSSRLQIRINWIRLVCLNGLSVGETKSINVIHNERLDLRAIGSAVTDILSDIPRQKDLFRQWTDVSIDDSIFEQWINKTIAPAWGKKAACRIFHICNDGWDVEFANPFEPGLPTRKEIRATEQVPGAPAHAETYYDVAQALAWIASNRKDAEERSKRQAEIAGLMNELETFANYPGNLNIGAS